MESIFTTLERRGHRARPALPRVGLHGREQAQPARAGAPIRDDAFAQLGETQAGRRHGRRAALLSSPSRRCTDFTPAEDAKIARQVRGHLRRAVLPERAGLPSRVAVRLRAGLDVPLRMPGNTQLANFTCLIPRVADRRRAGRPRSPPLYGHGLLGSAGEVTAGQRQGDGQRAQLRVLRHRLVRHVDAGPAERRVDPRRPLQLPVAGRPRPAGVRSNFLYLGRLLVHPQGFSSDPAFQVTKGGVPSRARHAPPLLRRQQPGRHHGRRADRARAGLQPRGARRAGHELLDAAATAVSTSTSTRRCCTPTTRTSSSGR